MLTKTTGFTHFLASTASNLVEFHLHTGTTCQIYSLTEFILSLNVSKCIKEQGSYHLNKYTPK
uniref:Uncharacterized protein n=1 Tax=Arundo donax TaxID=35708 RepID=A0A0A9BNF5_ARUDO